MSPLFSSSDLLLPPGSSEDEKPPIACNTETIQSESPRKKRKKRRKSSKSSLESQPNSTSSTVSLEDGANEEKTSQFEVEKPSSFHSESQARYFTESNVICSNCGLVGHLSVFCPEEVLGKRCFLCGGEGHLARNCPEELCHNCLRPGHKRKDCTLPRRNWKRDEKQMYPKYEDMRNMKKLKCYVCGKIGHLDCSFEKLKFCKIVSCYNCGQRGHRGGSCRKPSADEYLSAANKLVRTFSQSTRRKKQQNIKDEAVVFTEQVEHVLREQHSTRRMSAPLYLDSTRRENKIYTKRRRGSDIHS